MDAWEREIVELHDFFEGYFLGTRDDLERCDAALDQDFTMAGPDGTVAGKVATMAAIEAGYQHTDLLRILVTQTRLIAESPELVVAEYVESHELASRRNHRRSSVTFRRDPQGPNGLRWVHVQETWIDRGID